MRSNTVEYALALVLIVIVAIVLVALVSSGSEDSSAQPQPGGSGDHEVGDLNPVCDWEHEMFYWERWERLGSAQYSAVYGWTYMKDMNEKEYAVECQNKGD